MVDLRSSEGIFKQVKRSGLLSEPLARPAPMRKCSYHIDMFSGM